MRGGSALPCWLTPTSLTAHAACHRPNAAQATLAFPAAAPLLHRVAVRLNTQRQSFSLHVTQRRRRGHLHSPSRVRPVDRLAQPQHVPPVAASWLTFVGVVLTALWSFEPAVRSMWASLATVLATHWTVFVPIAAPLTVALLYRVWTHGDKLTAFQTDIAESFRELKADAAEREQRLAILIKGTQADAAEREQRLTIPIKGTQADAAEREQRMERSVMNWVEHTTSAVSAHASSARTAAHAAAAAAQNAQVAAVAAQAAAAATQAPYSIT